MLLGYVKLDDIPKLHASYFATREDESVFTKPTPEADDMGIPPLPPPEADTDGIPPLPPPVVQLD